MGDRASSDPPVEHSCVSTCGSFTRARNERLECRCASRGSLRSLLNVTVSYLAGNMEREPGLERNCYGFRHGCHLYLFGPEISLQEFPRRTGECSLVPRPSLGQCASRVARGGFAHPRTDSEGRAKCWKAILIISYI